MALAKAADTASASAARRKNTDETGSATAFFPAHTILFSVTDTRPQRSAPPCIPPPSRLPETPAAHENGTVL
ncbi:hypothetical protein CXI67_23985 [Salmonella enterica subsp. enterica serovar Typhimurium]|nr:hypothetical protein [Salmonella enterica subsp. enterica serovar Typhimurium]